MYNQPKYFDNIFVLNNQNPNLVSQCKNTMNRVQLETDEGGDVYGKQGAIESSQRPAESTDTIITRVCQ